MALTKLDKNLLGFSDDTDFVKLPSGTTAQRPSSPAAGQFRFNTTINDAEVYDGNNWVRMGIAPPTFTSVDYPGSATALDPAGGEDLVINGTQFNTGITITIGGTTPSSITRNSSTQLTVTAPAKTAGTYDIVFTNTDGGTATATNAVSYNGVPAFTNAAGSLGSVEESSAVNLSAAATEPDGGAITYAITSGSLPSGLSLNTSTGAITGTAPSVSADTTSNFTVTATDNENQTASRAYSITVTNISPSDSFNVVTYTGNGSTQSITGVGFQPDLVWIKSRNHSGGNSHVLLDSTRGTNKVLISNSNGATWTTTDAFTSFDSDGFTLPSNSGTQTNQSGYNYVAWCFKANGGTTSSNTDGSVTSTVQANNTLGFSIVKWTGTGGANTIGHNLNSAPELILIKSTSATGDWQVYAEPIGATKKLILNSSIAESTSTRFNNTSATSTVFSFNDSGIGTNSDFVAYAFTSVAGFSKIGSYIGISSGDIIVQTGFEPKFLMIKCTSDASTNWEILDSERSPGLLSNGSAVRLRANDASADASFNNTPISFLSNGFRINSSVTANSYADYDANGRTYMYMAFAADPDTTSPTLANSFDALTWSGQNSSLTINNGFKTGLLLTKARTVGHHWGGFDIVRGSGKWILPNETNAELSGSYGIEEFLATSTKLYGSTSPSNAASNTYIGYFWKADDNEPTINTEGSNETIVSANANAGFSIVKCSNITNDPGTFGHGLSSAPEMIIVKRLDGASGWQTYHTSIGTGNRIELNSNASTAAGTWNGTAPTSTVFSYNGLSTGQDLIAYCFHSVSGFSKFGSYTGNATAGTNITTGFQPDFVLTKDIDNTDNWRLYDSARGFNKVLYPSSSSAEDDNNTGVSGVTSTGFTLGNGNLSNRSGADYIYMAYKIN